jgi:plastocyanin
MRNLHVIRNRLRAGTALRVAGLFILANTLHAGDLQGRVTDASGAPIPNAVIVLVGGEAAPTAAKATVNAVMDQRKLQFEPHVLVVPRETAVRFPNSDDIRHQVYSFSEAKRFSLPLYHGVPAAPVVFDKAGEVVLGCNIHDRMLGYIYVADSPWFGKTGTDGAVVIANVPAGTYVARLWYPGLIGKAVEQPIHIDATGVAIIAFNNAEREILPEPAPTTGGWGDRRKREK